MSTGTTTQGPDDEPVWDVAVVGCGPVGAALAVLLGKRGHRVLVIERHRAPYVLPRAVHFDHEVGRILQACGLGEQLPTISEPSSDYEWRNGAGDVLLRFGGRPVGPSGWPDFNMFWQPALEELLTEAAQVQPTVEVWRGLRLVDLDQVGTADEPAVLVVEPDGGGTRARIAARYVVGCDGANSTVRELVGAPVTDLGFFYDWLIVDVVLREPRVYEPLNVQICEPSRPTTMVSGGPGRRRWEFMRLPGETVDELDDVDRAWQLLEPWDVTPAVAELERHAVYRFQARWAERWRTGNVLLAGDAAHQMPPFAGQGMCAGIRDAANLAWKLDLVLRDASAPALLDAYEAERRENVRAVIDFSMSLGKVICVTDPAEAEARDAMLLEGAAATSGPQAPPPLPGVTEGVIRAGDDLAGRLFVQGRVARPDSADDVDRFDDVFGDGWRLVSTESAVLDALPADLAGWFTEIGGLAVTVEASTDVDRTYATWFADHGVAVALQRPDFHLYGTAVTVDDAPALVADLRTALTAATIPSSPTSLGGTS